MKKNIISYIKLFFYYLVRIWYQILPSFIFMIIKQQIEYIRTYRSYNDKFRLKIFSTLPQKSTTPNTLTIFEPKEIKIIITLMDCFYLSKQKQIELGEPYLPGQDWSKQFKNNWGEYSDALYRKDINAMTILLRNFFRNDGISGLWGSNDMFNNFCNQSKYSSLISAEMMMKHYMVWKSLCPETSLSFLDAPKIGNPYGYLLDGALLYEPVFEYHFQADYFHRLLSKIDTPVIMEIGGGFGGLAYFLLKISPKIKYIGFDLPENILIQTYYLSNAFPNARILTYSAEFKKLDKSILEQFDIVLLPNFTLHDVESSLADLIVNIRSLSEMSMETIITYLREIDRIGRLFFFHENIAKPRNDKGYGIPSRIFPPLDNFLIISAAESKWPKYKMDSGYPCEENLFIHKDLLSSF